MPFAAWSFASAPRVRAPNRSVSLPGEPGPLSATVKPCALRYCWSARTSSPVTPVSRSRVNVPLDTAPAPVNPPTWSDALTLSMTDWSALKEARRVRIDCTCASVSPATGAPQLVVGADVVVVVGSGVVVVVVVVVVPPPPPPPPPPLLEVGVGVGVSLAWLPPPAVEQSPGPTVTVTVRAAVPIYSRTDCELLQISAEMSVAVFEEKL